MLPRMSKQMDLLLLYVNTRWEGLNKSDVPEAVLTFLLGCSFVAVLSETKASEVFRSRH